MKLGRANRAPSFVWQAALILLPVCVLAFIGFLSLRQDRLLVRQEAEERARGIAESLAPEFWQQFMAEPQSPGMWKVAFEASERGELLVPAPYPQVPAPLQALNPSHLNPTQERLWRETRRSLDSGDIAEAVRISREFIDSSPPEAFAGGLCYELALCLADSGDDRQAQETLRNLIQRFPAATGETGLPLLPLARLKLFWLERKAPNTPPTESEPKQTLGTVCQSLIEEPSIVTPLILSELAKHVTGEEQELVRTWVKRWEEQEVARKIYAAGQGNLADPSSNAVFWVQLRAGVAPASDINWLVVRKPGAEGINLFACRPESLLGSIVSEVAKKPGRVPEYLGIGVDVAGRRIGYSAPHLGVWREENWMGRRGGGVRRAYLEGEVPEILASADESIGKMRVSVFLTSPTVMLKRQQARAFWFKLLIGVSIASALVGLAATHRAFDRQLRLNAAKTNFVSSVSHELRAPIASVRLMTESLETGRIGDPQRQREYYRLMHQECRRLSSLVENVLDLSRIEQGRKQYEFEPTDLGALVRATVELMNPQAAERAVTLETAVSELWENQSLAPVVDGKAIQQALVNLLDNAIKHSRDGQRVTVGLQYAVPSSAEAPERPAQAEDCAERVLLWVEDQGEGIPPEDHERIFEQFYRRGSELTRQTQGIGIGLSIVKHIVGAHGGRVWVRSAVGKGSRFTIELPSAIPAAQCERNGSPAKP